MSVVAGRRTWSIRRAALAIVVLACSLVTTSSTSPVAAAPPPAKLEPGDTLQLQATGVAGVPATARAVAVSTTVVSAESSGYLIVWPCGGAMPNASNVNFTAGRTTANLVVVRPGVNGKVCLRTSARVHLLADVSGHFPSISGYQGLPAPTRLLDTRSGQGGTRLAAGQRLELPVTNVLGIPTDASAVAITTTVVSPSGRGHLTVWPCGPNPPTASNVNFTAGQTVANLAVVKPGTNGRICLQSSSAVDLLGDVTGWFAASAYQAPSVPTRVVDTRYGLGGSRLAAGQIRQVLVTGGNTGVPFGAAAVVVNVTVVGPAVGGYLTVWNCTGAAPTASNVNFVSGQTVANLAIAEPDPGGRICLYSSTSTDAVVDVSGHVPSTTTYVAAATPTRVLDTRSGLGMPSYGFLVKRTNGTYARWDPCGGPIRYEIDTREGTPTEWSAITAALTATSAATGLTFQFVRYNSTETASGDVAARIGFRSFGGNQLGVGGVRFDSNLQVRSGEAYAKTGLPVADRHQVLIHELAHMVGLDHTLDTGQVMYPFLQTRYAAYQSGDRAGLGMVGRAMPCFPASRTSVDLDDLDEVRWEDHAG